MTFSPTDLLRLLPEVVLAVFGIVVMVADPFIGRAQKRHLGTVALVGTVAAFAATGVQARYAGLGFSRMLSVDAFSVFLHFLLLLVTALAILASFRYLEREEIHYGEYYALLLFATIGMGLMVAANELVLIFLGLEISSIATYILAGFRRASLRSNEAAMKYFLLGSFATAFFLYGIALMFGATGTTFLLDIRAALATGQTNLTLTWMAIALLFVGLAFKVATVPFQVWTPDVYEGAPAPVTAFLSVGPKAAAFAAFLRIFFIALEPVANRWFWLIWVSAVLTMFVGNLAALVQTNVKRMLAYSSIAHAGYILIAFAAGNAVGVAAILFYLVAYALMKLGAFSVVAHVSGPGEERVGIEDYAGLGSRQPLVAACFSVFLFSLIGVPLTGGFLGKLYIFRAALEEGSSWLVWLVVFGAINTAISIYYYLRVVVAMYFREAPAEVQLAPLPASLGFVLTLAALGTVYLGLTSPVLQLATDSALALR
ncbi:MAG: NADH-quinone oxidoreductase subunit N [Acidobacteria bacterium]|nr:NADH-quinone oxidoreductase subunit N [Acidobacteriota bacterium]